MQLTIKLILIEEIMIIALFNNSDLAMILKKADLNKEKINIVARERLLMMIVFSKVVVDAIIMSDFR